MARGSHAPEGSRAWERGRCYRRVPASGKTVPARGSAWITMAARGAREARWQTGRLVPERVGARGSPFRRVGEREARWQRADWFQSAWERVDHHGGAWGRVKRVGNGQIGSRARGSAWITMEARGSA
jgi:hypothetical protein